MHNLSAVPELRMEGFFQGIVLEGCKHSTLTLSPLKKEGALMGAGFHAPSFIQVLWNAFPLQTSGPCCYLSSRISALRSGGASGHSPTALTGRALKLACLSSVHLFAFLSMCAGRPSSACGQRVYRGEQTLLPTSGRGWGDAIRYFCPHVLYEFVSVRLPKLILQLHVW